MLIKEKVEQAKKILKEFDVDCWITFVRESQINGDPTLAFFVNADVTWHSAFILSQDGKAHAIVGKYDQKSVEDTGAYDEVVGFVEGINEPLKFYLQKLNPKNIALNYSEDSEIADGITFGMYQTIFRLLKEIGLEDRIISAERIVSALRERKSKTEIKYIKSAIKITEEIFEKVAVFITPGKTEKQIAEYMKAEVEKRNLDFAWDPSMCPAVFTGPNTAGAHYSPTDRIIKRGDVLNMDFGVKFNGYCSDMQRTFYILNDGENEIPGDVRSGFETIVDAIKSSKNAMKPGVFGKDIDAIARNIVVNNGYDEFPHGLGHQVGRYSHDGTALLGPTWEKYAQKPFQKLEEGMVFTIEPRLEVANKGIVTIEEMVVVTSDGADWLTNPQQEIILIN